MGCVVGFSPQGCLGIWVTVVGSRLGGGVPAADAAASRAVWGFVVRVQVAVRVVVVSEVLLVQVLVGFHLQASLWSRNIPCVELWSKRGNHVVYWKGWWEGGG